MATFNSSDNQIISDLDSLFNASPQVLNLSNISLNQSFTITIQLTDDTTHIIELKGTDEVEKTAKEFCLKFGLDEKYEGMILEAIEKHLEGKGRTITGKEEKKFFSSIANPNGSYNYHTVLINNKIDTISPEEPISDDITLNEKTTKTKIFQRIQKKRTKPEMSNKHKINHSFNLEQPKINQNSSFEQTKKCSILADYQKTNKMPINNLYQRSKSFYQFKKEKINQIKYNLKEQEEKSLIFTPQIDHISILLEKNREEGSTFRRLYELHSTRKEKLKKEQERFEKEEVNACSFRPKINETSRIIDHLKNSSSSIDRFEKLHQNPDNKKKTKENKENLTFKPKINPILKTPEKFLERQENFLIKKDERCKSAIKERNSFIESNFFYPKINPSKSVRKLIQECSSPAKGNSSDIKDNNLSSQNENHSNLIELETSNIKNFSLFNRMDKKTSDRNEKSFKINNKNKYQKRRLTNEKNPFFLIFRILDFRGLNYICEGNLAIEKLGKEIRHILNPIFEEIVKLRKRMDLEDFEMAIESLLKNLKEEENGLSNYDKLLQKK